MQTAAPTRSWYTVDRFTDVFGIDLRTLALFRVLLGGYLIVDLCLRSRDLVAHYTDFGVMPRDVAIGYFSPSAFSLHLINGTAVFQAILFVIAGVFAAMLMIGWRTRLATIASWFLLLSLQNRNSVILSGEDNLAMVLAFWAMFLPLGARYSVDAALDRDSDARPDAYFSLAAMALLIQGMSMYFFSAMLKSDPKWLPDGTAVYYALQLDYFVTPFAIWLRQFEPLLGWLTYYVWWLELIGPLLMFSPVLHRPLRLVIMCAFITMHLAFLVCLNIGGFPFISIIMNLTFLPGFVWDRLEQWLAARRNRQLAIWYDTDCGFCLRMCRLFRTFLFLGDTPIRPAQDDATAGPLLEAHNSWVVSDGTGHHLKWAAFHCLVANSPVFGSFARLTGLGPIRRLGDRAYDLVADNRAGLSTITARLLPWAPVPVAASWKLNTVAVLGIVFITIQNISTLPPAGVHLPAPFVMVRQFFGLYQNWAMFAPYPEVTSPWPVIEGEMQNGDKVDVYNRRPGAPSFDKPPLVSAVYANYRWRKYLSNLEDQTYLRTNQLLALNYSRYLCRLWNHGKPYKRSLKRFKLYFNIERTPPPGETKQVKRRLVWEHRCFP